MEFFHKIKDKLKTKDAKVLLENFLSLSSLQIIGLILPLITLPYVLRTIGFEKYGIIVFAASLIAYFQALTDFSFRITATRDVAFFKSSPKKLNIIYSKVIIVKSIFLLLSLLIIAIIVVSVPTFLEYKSIYFWSSLMLVGYALFPEWFFQGIEKMRYITYLNLGIKLFFTLCIFIFIRKEEDFWMYPLLQSCGLIGAGIVGQIILMKKYQLKFIFLPFKLIKQTISKNFPIFINQFVPTLYNNTTMFVLGFFVSKTSLGVFNTLKSIISIEFSLLNSLTTAFFPYIVRKKEKFKFFLKLSVLFISLMILFTILAKPIIYWYLNIVDENYDIIFYVLLIGLFFVSINSIISVNYFLVNRNDKIVMKITTFSSLIGFILLYPLIYYFGLLGGTLVVVISQFLMGILTLYFYINSKKIVKNDKKDI